MTTDPDPCGPAPYRSPDQRPGTQLERLLSDSLSKLSEQHNLQISLLSEQVQQLSLRLSELLKLLSDSKTTSF